MRFNEKLIKLRKERGMTQEDLAFQMSVSRQSVSKWEVGEFEPDFAKLKELSKIFNVRIDYLLNEEEEEAQSVSIGEPTPTVSLKDADTFLSITKKNSFWIALGVFLCILSPVCLFLLGAVSEIPKYGLSESLAAGIGMIVLLLLVAFAVIIFIVCGGRNTPFSFLEKELFQTEKGLRDVVQKRQNEYRKRYVIQNAIGCALCILSLIPLFVGIILNEDNDLLIVCMLSLLFFIAGIGVFFIVRCGVIWGGFEKLLQTGEYTKEKKETSALVGVVSLIYWLGATAIFFAISFPKNNWKYSGIVWVIAGILYPALLALLNYVKKKK